MKSRNAGLVGLRLLDIFGRPIRTRRRGGILDHSINVSGESRWLEPGPVEALGQISWYRHEVCRPGAAGFYPQSGQIDPARHHFARTARINNFFHMRIFPQGPSPVNRARNPFILIINVILIFLWRLLVGVDYD